MGVTPVFPIAECSVVFLNALKKGSANITNIIRITQITFEFINGGLASVTLMSSENVLACKHWAQIAVYFLSKIGQLSSYNVG